MPEQTIPERVARLEEAHTNVKAEMAEINKHLAELVSAINGLNQFKWYVLGGFSLAQLIGIGAVIKIFSK